MAKEDFIRGLDKNVADKAVADWNENGGTRYPSVSVDNKGVISLYGGNGADRRRAAEFIALSIKRATHNLPTDTEMATARQIAYLKSLIKRDPGMASNFGLTINNLDGLSKDTASNNIDILANGGA